jgi:hypothetical protein
LPLRDGPPSGPPLKKSKFKGSKAQTKANFQSSSLSHFLLPGSHLLALHEFPCFLQPIPRFLRIPLHFYEMLTPCIGGFAPNTVMFTAYIEIAATRKEVPATGTEFAATNNGVNYTILENKYAIKCIDLLLFA